MGDTKRRGTGIEWDARSSEVFMSTLTPREVRIVDGFRQRCSDVAHKPDAQYREITVRTCALKCGWAIGLLSLYGLLSFFAQIV